jgi:cytochrome c553
MLRPLLISSIVPAAACVAAWLGLASPSLALAAGGSAGVAPPAWAYPVSKLPPPLAEVPDAQVPQRLPGTNVEYTKAQLRNLYAAPDWRPSERAGAPSMPPVVAAGRNPGVFACGYCHQPAGTGRPENANLTGLTRAYMTQQLADFKSGARKSTVAAMLPQALMARNAKNATDAELDAAAGYFASLPVRSLVSVVEAETVPRTEPRGWMLVALEGGGSEPIGQRIIEVPRDSVAVELRDPAVGFVAHVPPGSVERGRRLAADVSRGAPCTSCHGADLKGLADVPRLAGRSPSYLMRQLVDFVSGARNGPLAPPMVEVAKTLSEADMMALAAYAASLAP